MMPAAALPAPTESRPGHVVILDDAPFEHAALRRAAERTAPKDTVTGFYAAEDALDFLARDPRPEIDLLLVDLHMPRICGLEFLAAARARFGPGFARRIALALTLEPDPDLAWEIEALGIVDGWIEKPVASADLARLLGRAG